MPASNYRQLAESVFGPAVVRNDLWSGSYVPAIPSTISDFPNGGLLTAVMYLARWGHRRGNGTFVETFTAASDSRVAAQDVAAKLGQSQWAEVEGKAGEAILADLLIAHCLDTKNRESRRDTPVLRAYPVHYLASWLDLPSHFGSLRGVPEMITALLANQPSGRVLESSSKRTYFGVGNGFDNNLLLRTLGPAMATTGHLSSLTSDTFLEEESRQLSIEQLLMARIAMLTGAAPMKMKGTNPEIPNQQPLSSNQANVFRDDLRIFLEAYGGRMPWQSFVNMMEVGIGMGLATTFLATTRMLFSWEESGVLPEDDEPWPLFLDVSVGTDREIRQMAEESLGQAYAAMEHLPVVMSTLRVLDSFVSKNSRIKANLPEAEPLARERINFLGDVLRERVERASSVVDMIDQKCIELADALDIEDLASDVSQLLREGTVAAPVRLGEAIVRLMGSVSQEQQYVKFLSSCWIGDEANPQSMLRHRKAQRNNQKYEARSLVLTNTLLEYLVDRHLWKNGSHRRDRLTLNEFMDTLRDSYGFYIDQVPPGMTIGTEVLRQNRRLLERRLRDLGLLVGVNDAESMKHLRSRFDDPTMTGKDNE